MNKRDLLTEAVYFLLDNSSDYAREIYETKPEDIEHVVQELLVDILPIEVLHQIDFKLLMENIRKNMQ